MTLNVSKQVSERCPPDAHVSLTDEHNQQGARVRQLMFEAFNVSRKQKPISDLIRARLHGR